MFSPSGLVFSPIICYEKKIIFLKNRSLLYFLKKHYLQDNSGDF